MNNKKYALFCKIMDEMDVAYALMEEYDSLPHQYGQNILYQAESHMIEHIGTHEGITITMLAEEFGKSKSACSQMVKKLRDKCWVEQIRNPKNNREYNLFLTEEGKRILHDHAQFEAKCYHRSLDGLKQFSYEELENYLAIQKKINESFRIDVEESYQYSTSREGY